MKPPIKPGTEAGKSKEDGALGDIDEKAGHPGKGSSGPALNPEHSGSDAEKAGESKRPMVKQTGRTGG